MTPPSASARPRLFVIAAPSGAGKTSLVRELLAREPNLRVCVSHTTRRQRPNEVDGRDYHFVTVPAFESLVAADGFLEWAKVFDNCYGTSRGALAAAFGAGHDVILEIDWQGARQVRERTHDHVTGLPGCTGIFILPPSRAALAQRLRGRGTDDDAVIARRLADAVDDMTHHAEFDAMHPGEVFARFVGLRATSSTRWYAVVLFIVVPALTLSAGLYPWRDHPRSIQPVPTVFTAMLMVLCSILAHHLLAGTALGPGAGASPVWKRMLGALLMFLLLMFLVAAALFGVFLG